MSARSPGIRLSLSPFTAPRSSSPACFALRSFRNQHGVPLSVCKKKLSQQLLCEFPFAFLRPPESFHASERISAPPSSSLSSASACSSSPLTQKRLSPPLSVCTKPLTQQLLCDVPNAFPRLQGLDHTSAKMSAPASRSSVVVCSSSSLTQKRLSPPLSVCTKPLTQQLLCDVPNAFPRLQELDHTSAKTSAPSRFLSSFLACIASSLIQRRIGSPLSVCTKPLTQQLPCDVPFTFHGFQESTQASVIAGPAATYFPLYFYFSCTL